MLEHAILCRAYELYVQRGMAPGHVLTVDWNVAGIRFVKSATTTILRPHSHRTSPQQALRKAFLYLSASVRDKLLPGLTRSTIGKQHEGKVLR